MKCRHHTLHFPITSVPFLRLLQKSTSAIVRSTKPALLLSPPLLAGKPPFQVRAGLFGQTYITIGAGL